MTERKTAFDFLRVISLLGVIVMHVTSGLIGGDVSADPSYMLKLVFNAPFHYGVPIFVMISGALFLEPGKTINIKKLWTHNIIRLIIVYLLWSTIYGIWDYLQYKAGWKYIIWEIVNSRDHLWFLPMIIGLYIIVPMLSTWVHNATKKEIKYFLILFIGFQIVCETVKALPTPEIVEFIIRLRNIQLVCSYVGYFVLGYYLIHVGVSKRMVKIIYGCGIVCGILSIAALTGLSYMIGRGAFEIVDSYSVLTFGWATAIFVGVNRMYDKNSCLCKEERSSETNAKIRTTDKFISELGKDTLGAYLCHVAVIELLMTVGYNPDTLPVAIGIPLYVLAVYVISTVVALLLRRIPYIGRYMC